MAHSDPEAWLRDPSLWGSSFWVQAMSEVGLRSPLQPETTSALRPKPSGGLACGFGFRLTWVGLGQEVVHDHMKGRPQTN